MSLFCLFSLPWEYVHITRRMTFNRKFSDKYMHYSFISPVGLIVIHIGKDKYYKNRTSSLPCPACTTFIRKEKIGGRGKPFQNKK